MGEILDSDWSRENLLRSDWLGPSVALYTTLDAAIFVLLSVFILIETICPNICSKSRLKSANSLLPFNMRRSNTSLLKLPTGIIGQP